MKNAEKLYVITISVVLGTATNFAVCKAADYIKGIVQAETSRNMRRDNDIRRLINEWASLSKRIEALEKKSEKQPLTYRQYGEMERR